MQISRFIAFIKFNLLMAFIELVSFCYPSPKILNNIGSLVKMPSVTGIYLRRTSLS
jgi:hypothetical protein